MEALTISACILSLDRDFSGFAARRLQELGVELEIRRVPTEHAESTDKLFK